MSLADVKKGEVVVLLGFTGIRLADMKVTAATKTELTLEKKDGSLMVFNRKTGVQTNVEAGKEKYANKIVHPDHAPAPKVKKAAEPAKAAKAADKPAKAKKAKAAPAPVVEDEDDDEYEEL